VFECFRVGRIRMVSGLECEEWFHGRNERKNSFRVEIRRKVSWL